MATGRLTVDDGVDPQFWSNDPSPHGIHRFPLKMFVRPILDASFTESRGNAKLLDLN